MVLSVLTTQVLFGSGHVITVLSVYNLLWQWQELQLQQCWFSWLWLLYSLQSSGTSRSKLHVSMIVCHKTEEHNLVYHVHI